jgi:hypothetical protein
MMRRHEKRSPKSSADLVALVSRILPPQTGEEHPVPEHLVHSAKAMFRERKSATAKSLRGTMPVLPVQLVYTSMDCAMAGTRSALETTVQAVYRAGDYAIDLQIEPEAEENNMVILGQVVNRATPSEPMSGVPVILTARNKEISESRSNRFGEFCLLFRRQRDLKLCLEIDAAGNRVEIPLKPIMAGPQ